MNLRLHAFALFMTACPAHDEPGVPQNTAAVHIGELLTLDSGSLSGTDRAPRDKATLSVVRAMTPSTLRASVQVPAEGRLDLALGIPKEGAAVTFRLQVESDTTPPESVLETTQTAPWSQHGISLAHYAGQQVTLVFEASSTTPDAIGLWGAPTLSGQPPPTLPNILFYVIDGGGADLMSLYGYERPTTPQLEHWAQQGVVFEQARTSSAWTKPSTASFMTSLHHSVLGGFTKNEDHHCQVQQMLGEARPEFHESS